MPDPAGLPDPLAGDPFVAAYPENRPFWAAAERGVLSLKHCRDCQQPHWFPREVCPFCGSDRTHWLAASGRGTVYSHSVVRRVAEPYVLAYVQLAEGPVLMSTVLLCPPEAVHIGQRVQVFFVRTDQGRLAPAFVPAG